MTEYCDICGEKLDPDEEEYGICKACSNKQDEEYKIDEDYIDPGIT